jgi:hypothetical protein
MRAPAWFVIAVALVFLNGCRSSDWIDRTLVTVDVTGVWEGNYIAATGSTDVVLVLQQQGARVTGQRNYVGAGSNVSAFLRDAAIEGIVNGDTFTFHDVNATFLEVTLSVNGDEMAGVSQRGTRWQLRRRPQ